MDEIRDGVAISFDEVETIIWQSALASHLEVMKAALGRLDKLLEITRDKTRYELKGMRPLQKVVRAGTLRFERRYYWDRVEGRWVALLDRFLGIEERKRASRAVRAVAVEAAVEGRSYRAAQRELEREAGQAMFSHEAIRQCSSGKAPGAGPVFGG